MEKPDVDQIDGLSPAISIDQKGASRNPRSTVGTVTEIYDHLRLLFARIGHPHCPTCGREIERQTVQQIVDQVYRLPGGHPAPRPRPARQGPQDRGRPRSSRPRASRASSASGSTASCCDLDEAPTLDKYKRHTIEVVVDRFVVRAHRERDGRAAARTPRALADSIETALRLGEGVVVDRAGAARRRGAGLRGAPLQRALQLPLRRDDDRRARAAELLVQLAARRLPDLHRPRHAAGDRPGPA